MKTNLFKTFQPFINKCGKSITTLGYVLVDNGIATITDGETTVQFHIGLSDGLYSVVNGEAYPVSVDPKDFPVFPILRIKSSCLISSNLILQYAPCILSDELRPVMNAIYLDNENIVASDCHILKYQSGYSDSSDNDFKALFKPSVALLSRCRSAIEPITIQTAWSDDQNAEADPKYLQFSFSDCTITQRMVDGNYPNWKSVIPKYSPTDTVTFLITPSILADMVKTVKAFKNKSNLVKVSATAMVHSNDEFELKREWPVQWCETPYRTPDSILMPMMICNDQSNGTTILGFDANNLNRLCTLHKGNVMVGYIEDKGSVSRAMAVWLQQPNEKTPIVPFYGTINGVIPVTKTEEKEPEPEPETEQQPEPEPEPLPEPEPEPLPEQQPEQEPETKSEPEPEPAPQSEIPARPEGDPNPKSEIRNPKSVIPAAQTIHIVDYSEKSIAVFGSTRQFKDEFLKIWGRWIPVTNPATGTKSKAWVFSRKRKAQVEQIIKAA